ncbi:MAG: Hsp33 family molecular chaperone HslO [Akkermansia sp.]|nr:Hsp33 family molecular chaperone HslO [Akkermansia sp.]
MTEAEQKPVEEFTKVESIFVRQRNCLLLRADFSPLFVDYYLHLMQHGLRNAETEDTVLKKLLAYFTLHLVSRPWQEYHAWTFNVCTPRLANYFISGSSLTEDVVGRAFREGVRETDKNMLFAQNLLPNKEPQTSVITLPMGPVEEWVQDFYRQSEQRQSRAFDLGEDKFVLITAQPDADHDWLQELTVENVRAISEVEQTKLLETRKFKFRCGCTVEKILPVVRAMKHDFADLLSEQGFLEINCPRCGASYKVTPDMVQEQDK